MLAEAAEAAPARGSDPRTTGLPGHQAAISVAAAEAAAVPWGAAEPVEATAPAGVGQAASTVRPSRDHQEQEVLEQELAALPDWGDPRAADLEGPCLYGRAARSSLRTRP
jgi:hypothetical protein